ncbi:putative alpha-isopropylmalate/homocitrate synthase family transferase [compost metagenome]
MHLADYKVRVLDEKDATAAKVRVLIESKNYEDVWSNVGVSENVIEASWEALLDSFRYALLEAPTPTNDQSELTHHGLVNH